MFLNFTEQTTLFPTVEEHVHPAGLLRNAHFLSRVWICLTLNTFLMSVSSYYGQFGTFETSPRRSIRQGFLVDSAGHESLVIKRHFGHLPTSRRSQAAPLNVSRCFSSGGASPPDTFEEGMFLSIIERLFYKSFIPMNLLQVP